MSTNEPLVILAQRYLDAANGARRPRFENFHRAHQAEWAAKQALIGDPVALAEFIVAQAAEAEQLQAALDGVYSERAHVVAALSKLFPASLEEHDGEDWDDDWRTVCFIDLPSGQVSWHIARTDLPLFAHLPKGAGRIWDGHDTPTKYARLDACPQELVQKEEG